jgi:serine/threonine protein kinase
VGTERYLAPEVHESKPYKGFATDIFALGVVLFLMVTGVMPFYHRAIKSDQLYSHVYRNDDKAYWEALAKAYPGSASTVAGLSEEFKKLSLQFFCYHYFDRITLEKLKAAKWVTAGATGDA